ncbi:HNH endonuclease [Sphingomonas sp. NSE70-1]|uniref:HNH endonuclease n=1 Tax=Sphingomonas caseinilyticus TaxID=2908205 RepID=A0ABT0RVX5_9SPHN|nr:HNH endonuclease [Sphingomonas caseinilyticus]MCL6699167.1 HNH endonuclease [Sphingomonas caseinilyticus]
MAEPGIPHCWLCARPLGQRIEWHHPVPKSRGGREKRAIHPICHRTLHARFSNAELERIGDAPGTLRSDEEIARFLIWIANKDPDFHAPTHRRK